jgi:hypothetical protein
MKSRVHACDALSTDPTAIQLTAVKEAVPSTRRLRIRQTRRVGMKYARLSKKNLELIVL